MPEGPQDHVVESEEDLDGAVPVCPTCLRPFDPLQHYCENCGEAVGRCTPYIPFVNIRFNYSIFGRLWAKVFREPGPWFGRKLFYLAMIVVFVPIMLVGLPFLLIRRLHQRRQGLCVHCSYNLTGNVSGICPECGNKAEAWPAVED